MKTGVRQGCILLPMLFLLVVNRIINTITEDSRTGMLWTHCYQVHNLDFADDIGLLSHNYKHAQDKIQLLATTQEMTALTIKRSKAKAMRINSAMEEPIKLNSKATEDAPPLRIWEA